MNFKRFSNFFNFALRKRQYCDESKCSFQFERLQNRKLIKLTGAETPDYLQGLITNDIKHLNKGKTCIYTLFLNTKGRVINDSIIYKCNDNETYYLECDANIIGGFLKHLNLYKIRRKIKVEEVNDNILVVYNENEINNFTEQNNEFVTSEDYQKKLNNLLNSSENVYKDPRLAILGFRFIGNQSENLLTLFKQLNIQIKEADLYTTLRYKLGIAEGGNEIPFGQAFPLEINGDYLHGISFHKGCYIGQELTARTFHTGVIRKRLMPLYFNRDVLELDVDVPINNPAGKTSLGKLRCYHKNVGIGLLRITEVSKLESFTIGDYTVSTKRPLWWPVEATKEQLAT